MFFHTFWQKVYRVKKSLKCRSFENKFNLNDKEMKNILKKAILPVAVFGIAIATAFATNVNKKVADPIYPGPFYFHDTCDEVSGVTPEQMNCQLQFSSSICTWSNNEKVYASSDDGMSCTIPLYKRPN